MTLLPPRYRVLSGKQIRLPTVTLMSEISIPRFVPLMVKIVPPAVGPLMGCIAVIAGSSHLAGVTTNDEEQLSV